MTEKHNIHNRKILILGAGVIGTLYGWQLQKSGCNVTHLIRKSKIDMYKSSGIQIRCLDLRTSKRSVIEEGYHPGFVDSLSKNEKYDFIIVAVNSNQLEDILHMLKNYSGTANIVFLQNMRPGDDELIAKYLDASRYFIAYPFKAGGGRKDNLIDGVIFGMPLTNTVIGEVNGQISDRVKEFSYLLKQANMNPKIITDIIPYIRTHYIWGAGCLAAYIKTGNYENFKQAEIIKESYLAMREGWNICVKQGINPKRVAPTKYYYLPFFMLVPFTQWIYRQPGMQEMFEGHVQHSTDEMKDMYFTLLALGKKFKVDMPIYESYLPYVKKYFNLLE
jgi:2-dehydropantoate 2-reductase